MHLQSGRAQVEKAQKMQHLKMWPGDWRPRRGPGEKQMWVCGVILVFARPITPPHCCAPGAEFLKGNSLLAEPERAALWNSRVQRRGLGGGPSPPRATSQPEQARAV